MKSILLALSLLLSIHMYSQSNFRGMNWGNSISELKSKYPNVKWEIDSKENFDFYITEDVVGGLVTDIAFVFIDNKLKTGVYKFKEEHPSDNSYYQDFITISNFLNQKYDMVMNENWNDTRHKDNPNDIGYALVMGFVQITETFEDDKTSITHNISSNENLEIEHLLIYQDMIYLNSKKNSALDDF